MKRMKNWGIGLLLAWAIISGAYFVRKAVPMLWKWQTQRTFETWKTYEETEAVDVEAPEIRSCYNAALLDHLRWKKRLWKGITAGNIDPALVQSFDSLYRTWPDGLIRFTERHVRHIYIVKGLRSSALALAHNDSCFTIVVDERVLHQTPNQWLSDREKTILHTDDTPYTLHHVLEKEDRNLPVYTLESLLIHEIGHCIGAYTGFTRSFTGGLQISGNLMFMDEVFEMRGMRMAMRPHMRQRFPQLVYYRPEERIAPEDYIDLLKQLENSPFPSPYGTVNDLEFFAEWFHGYVHCVLQQRPLQFEVRMDGQPVVQIPSPVASTSNEGYRTGMALLLQQL
jgi:hypothetical protein